MPSSEPRSGTRPANIAVTLLRALYNKVVVWELWTGGNPTFGIKKFREVARERFLFPDEMPRFLEALREVKDETTRDFILLLLMTGARRGNVQAMRWEDVNLESALWRIPDTKIGEPHTVALSPEAIAVLSKRKESAKGDYVFPGPGKSKHLEEPKRAWVGVLERAGIKELRLHDLRRTHGSWMAASGASLPMIGKALGHKNVATTAIYARLNLDPVRAVVRKTNAAIFQSAGNLIPSAKVVKLEDASIRQAARGGSV